MFQQITRHVSLNQFTILSIHDTCFIHKVVDFCNCKCIACLGTTLHLIKTYEQRKLNVAKNLARYYTWLSIYCGGESLLYLDDHNNYLQNNHYEINKHFNKNYYNSIWYYLKSPKLMRY